jgi:transposase
VRVMVATKPVDFRKGADGLAALVRESLAADPFSGAVYVFRAKRADRIKLVFWDGTGLCRNKRNKLEKRLGEFVGTAVQVRAVRAYPAVLEKYQNPDQPCETWSGRGRKPRWVTQSLANGKSMDGFCLPETA